MDPAVQFELLSGLEIAQRKAEELANPSLRMRRLNEIESSRDLLTNETTREMLAVLHSGLCQTFLPHRRPRHNHTVWERTNGRFTLMVTPGVIKNGPSVRGSSEDHYVGVPYGPKSRILLIFLQTEVKADGTVFLGRNQAALLESLGVPRTGGERGGITQVKEQFLRIARCGFTMQWDEADGQKTTTIIRDTRLIDGLEIENMRSENRWQATIRLAPEFHAHLREHAVPLDKRAIAHLKDSSLGLDLYAMLAHRLPRLKRVLRLSWEDLQSQIGSEYRHAKDMAARVKGVLPAVKIAYPEAGVEVGRGGLILSPSPCAVPRTLVNGYRLIEGSKAA